MDFTIRSDFKPKSMDGINLYLNAGWGVPNDYVNLVQRFENAYKNSFFITAFSGDKLVGMIRYLTDGFHDTQILECLVLKDFQCHGIAKEMLDKLKELYPETAIYLQCTENYHEVFLKEGFKKHKLIGMSYYKRS